MWASASLMVQRSLVSGRGTGFFHSAAVRPATRRSKTLNSRLARSITSARVWRIFSLSVGRSLLCVSPQVDLFYIDHVGEEAEVLITAAQRPCGRVLG